MSVRFLQTKKGKSMIVYAQITDIISGFFFNANRSSSSLARVDMVRPAWYIHFAEATESDLCK